MGRTSTRAFHNCLCSRFYSPFNRAILFHFLRYGFPFPPSVPKLTCHSVSLYPACLHKPHLLQSFPVPAAYHTEHPKNILNSENKLVKQEMQGLEKESNHRTGESNDVGSCCKGHNTTNPTTIIYISESIRPRSTKSAPWIQIEFRKPHHSNPSKCTLRFLIQKPRGIPDGSLPPPLECNHL